MAFRLAGADLILAPFVLGGVPLFTVRAMDAFGVPIAITLGGLVSLLLSLAFVRVEITDARWWRTHFRHSLFVYPWLLVSVMMLGEGLTAPASKPIAIMTVVLIAADAFAIRGLRHRVQAA